MPLPPARHPMIRNTFLMVSALYLSGFDAGTGDEEATAERAARLEEAVGSVIAVINAPTKKLSAA